jgi:hypothetical protein
MVWEATTERRERSWRAESGHDSDAAHKVKVRRKDREMTGETSRRKVVAAALALPGIGLLGRLGHEAAAQDATPTSQAEVGSAKAPDWTFSVLQVQRPYTGTVTKPKDLDPALEVIAAQILITNASDQVLSFSLSDIRLKDDSGTEYPAGDVIGSEPRLVTQDLPDGERTRGWVWFGVPAGTVATQLILSGPVPSFRVPLEP